ncbi:MAG: hypothetical protein WKF57_06065 [Nakamurella sp.]
MHPDSQVRQALLTDGPPDRVLELLTTDLDPLVRTSAQHRLGKLETTAIPVAERKGLW